MLGQDRTGRYLEEANYANGDSRQLGDARKPAYAWVILRRWNQGNGIELEGLAGVGNPINIIIRKKIMQELIFHFGG